MNNELLDETLKEFSDLKRRNRDNLAAMLREVTDWLANEVEGDNYRKIDKLNDIKELTEFAIIEDYMKQNGYFYDEDNAVWKRG